MQHIDAKHIGAILGMLARTGAKRVLVQVPCGLKMRAIELVEALEKEGYEAVLSADDCFGACDLPLVAAQVSGADLILHIGHAKFCKEIATKVPIIYYEWPIEVELNIQRMRSEMEKIRERKIGLVSSVQYARILPRVAEALHAAGKCAEIGGCVLGCWVKSAEALAGRVDAIMFVGSGMFHPLGFKCDYFLDVERGTVGDVRKDVEKFEKVRWARISKARDARTFGILVSTKPGQCDMQAAERIKAQLEGAGRKAFILIADKITDAMLQGIAVDAFVNTACPRLADEKWSKPFVNAADAEMIADE